MRWLVGVVALTVVAVPSRMEAQSRWVRVYSSARMSIDLDTTTVERDGDTFAVWMRTEHSEAQGHSKGAYWSKKTRYLLQCRPAMRSKLLGAIYYRRDGEVISSVHISPEEAAQFEWLASVPDTVGEVTDLAACGVLAGIARAGH